MSIADRLNADLEAHAPALHASLSRLGRRAYFPQGIPAQSAEARGTRYNATIGQVTDGRGAPLPLPVLAEAMSQLDPRMSHLYSPPSGHKSLRQAWAARQRRLSGGSTAPTTLPFVALGLSQALNFAAELFLDEDVPVLVPSPRWGNYDQMFGVRRGARLVPYALFEGMDLSVEGLDRALSGLQGPAMLVLNFPHNPSGMSPTAAQARAIVQRVLAHPGPLVVLVDDAYAGMMWADGLPERSLFWDLAEAHDPERHVIARCDGVTKELLFFPGRVGFLTFAMDPDSPAAAALESKLGGLARSSNGSPPGPSQAAVLRALEATDLEAQIEASHQVLRARHEKLSQALASHRSEALRPYPFNSGVFAIVGLADGVDAEQARRALIDEQSVGVIRVGALNALRLAYCSVAEEDIDGLVERLAAHLG